MMPALLFERVLTGVFSVILLQVSTPACPDFESTVRAVERLSGVRWDELDAEQLAALWPHEANLERYCAPVCETLADEAAAIDRCCAECGVCPWLSFDDPDDPASLFAIAAVLCPRPLPDAVSRGERFAREIGAPSAPLYQYESPEFRTTAFSWERDDGEVLLEVAMIQRDAEWLTRLVFRRCRPRPVVALLGRGSDRALQALDDVEIKTLSDGVKRINVDYLSQCYFTDRECVEAEARAAWPEMREWADALGVSVVWLTAWSCSGGSGITFRRDDSGTWSDNLVYPH